MDAPVMKISRKGLDLIKRFEGFSAKPYLCPAGVMTIGYGSTGSHVIKDMRITEAEGEALLRKDVARFEDAVRRYAPRCTQGQFDALVSFAFNLGIGALRKSTLLKKHNAGDYEGAAAEFARWDKAGGKVLAGLVKRRAAEAAVYRGKP